MAVTVQVQDVAHGCPAGGLEVRVERRAGAGWVAVGHGTTDDGGRFGGTWTPPEGGVLRLVFEAEKFFASLGLRAGVAEVCAALRVDGPGRDHRVSVLLAPVAATVHVEAS
jgi:5-hydroxyisourate hydrolase-like protein (transthyretin family)